jgi:hypothetical protein
VRRAGGLVAALATFAALGCGGSLRPAILIASARAAYPDCDDLRIADRDEGVRQWIVVCGEARLFGLGRERAVPRDGRGRTDDEELAILVDQSPPIQWRSARRVEDASAATSSVVAWLEPLRVQVTMLGVGEESSYLTVESPHHESCATRPDLYVRGERLEMESAETETRSEPRDHFAQRIDLSTLRLIASEAFEISYCGERHALDEEVANAFRAWAADRVERRE